MKQTAVEWIIEQLNAMDLLKIVDGSNAITFTIEQAKEMEKQQKQDRWKTVFEETPPSSIQLLAESPDGVIHLTNWRAGYQIFSCQCKTDSSDDWKWKTI